MEIDLHGYSLDEANKKIFEFINECYEKNIKSINIITGKGLRSKNVEDPYSSADLGMLKNSVPNFIKNNSELMSKIKHINFDDVVSKNKGNFNIYLKKTNFMKNFKPRIKARLRKSKIDIKKKLTVVTEKAKDVKNKTDLKTNIQNFFDWVKGAELVELEKCNISEDPVRPELDNTFRTNYGRKIFGVKFKDEIYAVMCFAFTDEIPKSVEELDLFSQDAFLKNVQRDPDKVGRIAIAYTVWSKKKGGGKLIVKEVYKMIKKSNHLNRLVTLSPLTDMARKFHLRNGAVELQVNETTQNFEYKVIK